MKHRRPDFMLKYFLVSESFTQISKLRRNWTDGKNDF